MKLDPVAQCRFFSADDACRFALQAYYGSHRYIEPPPGEPWMIDGEPYAGPGDFADAFIAELQVRISLCALDRLGYFDVLGDPGWNLHKLAADIEPQKMAPIIAARETQLAQIDADFLGDEMNRLPPGDNPVHNRVQEDISGE